jgi:hypothetical protein
MSVVTVVTRRGDGSARAPDLERKRGRRRARERGGEETGVDGGVEELLLILPLLL